MRGNLHAEERTKESTNDGKEIVKDRDRLGNDKRHQAVETDTTTD
jgi:hypothetical protein